MKPTSEIAIGELSRRTGCNIETIRYYERIGLLPPPARTASRYRRYGSDDERRLMFVRRARELGFALGEVRTLLGLALGGRDACAEVRTLAVAHSADIRAKIADLQAMERALAGAIRLCDAGKVARCPLIDALSTDAAAGGSRLRQRPISVDARRSRRDR